MITMNSKKIGRYAPSPSGRLHLGNIMSSLLAWLDVRSQNGTLIFRLEDLDPARSETEYANLMAEDLHWLGLDWDTGWFPDRNNNYSQGQRSELYEEAFEKLRRKDLLYPCYCSRSQRLAASAPHPGEKHDSSCSCRYLTASERNALERKGKKPAWKVIVPDRQISFEDGHYGLQSENLCEQGDFIVRRSDGVFAYQLAVSVDDSLMGINSVVRARDLMSSSFRQIWLIEELGFSPPKYSHAPLLVSSAGRKLSKREGDLNMEALRERFTAEELLGHLAVMAGIIDEYQPLSSDALIPLFSWDRIVKKDIQITI